jgi:hypothetical protein
MVLLLISGAVRQINLAVTHAVTKAEFPKDSPVTDGEIKKRKRMVEEDTVIGINHLLTGR